jgi:hypothetical protein
MPKPMNKLEKTLLGLAFASVFIGDAIIFKNIIQYNSGITDPPFYETHIPALILAAIATISYYMRGEEIK